MDIRLRIFLFLFILITPSVYAYSIGISPVNLSFDISENEAPCKSIIVFTKGYDGTIYIKDLWSNSNISVKDLSEYYLSSRILNITISYLNEFEIHNKEKIDICVSGRKSGNFYGIIIISTKDGVAIGNWIDVHVDNKKHFDSRFLLLQSLISLFLLNILLICLLKLKIKTKV
jgi:hypothetical protein